MYLETSVISAYFDFWKSNQEQKYYTRKFLKEVVPYYEVYISDICLQEFRRSRIGWQRAYLRLVRGFEVKSMNKAIDELAKEYIKGGIIPKSKINDANHLAVASFYKVNYLVSWNQKHIVRPYKINQIVAFNVKHRLYVPTIVKPIDFFEIS